MTFQELKTAFRHLSPGQQAKALARLAHNLTICARAAYPGQVEQALVAAKLSAFNEAQHQISGQLMHLLADDPNRCPDDIFLDGLLERARVGQCVGELGWALARALPAAGAAVNGTMGDATIGREATKG